MRLATSSAKQWVAIGILGATFSAGCSRGRSDGPADTPPAVEEAAPEPEVIVNPRAPMREVPLGEDRGLVKVDIPKAKLGEYQAFTFGEERSPGWVAQLPESRQLASAAYGDGRIYIGGGFETVAFYALEAETGKTAWAKRTLADNGPTAAVFDEGKVIFNTESCTLFTMDAKTGRELWHKFLGDPTLAQVAVKDGLIYSAYPTGSGQRLGAYRVSNGSQVWNAAVDGELLSAPIVHGGSIYATTIHGTVYRLGMNGSKLWSKGVMASSAPWASGDQLHLALVASGVERPGVMAVSDGELLRTEHVVAGVGDDVPRTMSDWKKVWAFEGARPVVLDGVRYHAMGKYIEASDASTGARIWTRRYEPGDKQRTFSTVALTYREVVLTTRDGRLLGFDRKTGEAKWAFALGRDIVAQPIIAKGWIYVTTTGGEVVGLKVGDKELDGWHMWGGNPTHDGLM